MKGTGRRCPVRPPGGSISAEPRINDRIRVPEVRLVGPNGEQVGIVAIGVALQMAQESDLDLVEVAPMARPPVAKLMDYGKFKYETAQKARESRKNQVLTVIKEMKLRPKIDPHDYETKKGHVVRFLKQGDKVKITIMFRGREQSRPELGFRLLQRLGEDVQELGFVESQPQAGRPQHDHGHRSPQERRRPQEGRRRRPSADARPGPTPASTPPDPQHDRERTTDRVEERSHAQAEDPQRRQEALQGDRHRQAAAREGRQAPPARAQVSKLTRRLTGTTEVSKADTKTRQEAARPLAAPATTRPRRYRQDHGTREEGSQRPEEAS